jgi:hypothetical protein
MSLFRWIFASRKADAQFESSGLSRMEPTRPVRRDGRQPGPVPSNGQPANRKSERMARRELLYAVVRECMVKSGVLSSSYKFKVLSLDGRGRQFLVMVDLAGDCGLQAAQFGEIEALIAQSAKLRHDIIVTSVYWRTNEHVAVGDPRATPRSRTVARPSREPIGADEIAAFKQALQAAGGRHVPAAAAAATMPATGFEDTELSQPDAEDPRAPLLSGTQYGELR